MATDEVGALDNDSFNLFGNFDIDVTDRLTLTLGGAYTRDAKDFSISQTNNNLFSTALDLTDRATVAPLLTGLGVQGFAPAAIEGALAASFPTFFNGLAFTPENIALVTSTPAGAAGFQAFQDQVTAGTIAAVTTQVAQGVAASELTNPDTNALLALQGLQVVPQTASLVDGFEDNRVVDDNFSFTVRGAYDVSDNINVYASYSTGFKASSVNLSRNSTPNLQDFVDENGRPIAAAFNALPANTSVRLLPNGEDLPVPPFPLVDLAGDGIFPAGQLIDNNITDAQIPLDGVVNLSLIHI